MGTNIFVFVQTKIWKLELRISKIVLNDCENQKPVRASVNRTNSRSIQFN